MKKPDLQNTKKTKGATKKRLFKALCLTLPAIIICLFLAECVIRLFDLSPEIYSVQKGRFRLSENPLIGYELVPGYETQDENPMTLFKGRANSLGFRDREHAIQKPKGVFRIIVLGDSIVQGFGIENDEDLFTSVLSRLLIETGRKVEVFNFGVSGYNTQQEVETLREKGLQFQPDLVVVTYCLNDTSLCCGPILSTLLQERDKYQEKGSRSGHLVRDINRILLKSALFRMIYFSLPSKSDELENYDSLKENTVTQYLDLLAQLSRTHGFEVLIAIMPAFDNIGDYQHHSHHKTVMALAQSMRFYHLDLYPGFFKLAHTEMVSMDDMHPTVAGHKLTGELIADFIESEIFKN